MIDYPQHPEIMDRIAVVLVRPMGDGNVGQVARAMRNFGMSRLIIVQPQYVETELCRRMAVSAYQLVRDAEYQDDLATALKDFHYVVGASRRLGKFRQRFCSSRALPDWLLPRLADGQTGALVFGNEPSGLNKQEMDLCNELVEIITDPAHRSLNLAQAVLLLAYELFTRACEAPLDVNKHVPAPHDKIRRFYEHMRRVYLEVGFIDKDNPERNMRQLRRLFSRAAPNELEVRILHGLLSDTEWYLKHVAEVGKRDGYREMAGDGESGTGTSGESTADRSASEQAEQVEDLHEAVDPQQDED
ncbi:MAG: RNA methyltransferase [Candidatus Lernaella stagnicola]|nr:RNA methyltransferase [Candidatus Lernaella stagnicola]